MLNHGLKNIRTKLSLMITLKTCIGAFTMLLSLSCVNDNSSNDVNIKGTEKEEILVSTNVPHADRHESCLKCDSVYLSFPDSGSEFTKLYGYSDSTGGNPRYSKYEEDLDHYSSCMEHCEDRKYFIRLATIASQIEYEADAPAYLHSKIVALVANDTSLLAIYYKQFGDDNTIKLAKFLLSPINLNDPEMQAVCRVLASLKQPELEKFTKRCLTDE